MNEEQWLRATDVFRRLDHVRTVATARQLRLFTCAACRRIWRHLTDARCRTLVEALEEEADYPSEASFGTPFEAYYWAAYEVAHYAAGAVRVEEDPLLAAMYGALAAVHAANGVRVVPAVGPLSTAANEVHQAFEAAVLRLPRSPEVLRRDEVAGSELMAQSGLLLDILGNSFKPVVFDPTWRTTAVVGLATGIYADRAFDRVPVLSDALEDAGCTDDDILAHCRGEGPHARGCWVVDAVLGKT
jgi:hypothetical protein